MKLSFRKFLEEKGFVDQTPTASYHGQAAMNTPNDNFPDLATYRQYKVLEDPRKSKWTDMQWMVQYHFDRSHALERTKKTPNVTPMA